jgi:hypothetical protein
MTLDSLGRVMGKAKQAKLAGMAETELNLHGPVSSNRVILSTL